MMTLIEVRQQIQAKLVDRKIREELPESLLRGRKKTLRASKKRKPTTTLPNYHLDGEWGDWLQVALRYERKVPYQDRLDMRHDILLELHKARERDCQKLPVLRAYRIASLTVALYWRKLIKREVRVCLYSGVATELHCQQCSVRHNDRAKCIYRAYRPPESLYKEVSTDGKPTRLIDTVADDTAIDVDAWLDDRTFLLGCPMRLIEIGYKRLNGIALTNADRSYLKRWRKKEQKNLF